MSKTCGKCGIVKELSEYSYSTKNKKDHLQSWCKQCSYKKSAVWAKENPEKQKLSAKKRDLKKKFGITLEDYWKMVAEQDGKCAICGTTNPGTGRNYFAVDHDHETGKIRGLLCSPCNHGLGILGDTLEVLQAAVKYLSKEGK